MRLPGYVGYEEGGQLTGGASPTRSFCWTKVEKAHPDVFNLLLGALDDRTVTDSLGRRIDFRTRRHRGEQHRRARPTCGLRQRRGFGTAARSESRDRNNRGIVEKALKKAFAPGSSTASMTSSSCSTR